MTLMRKIVTMIEPKLEYEAKVWSHHKKNTNKLQRVQRPALKMVQINSGRINKGFIKKISLPTLEVRRKR